MQEKRAYLFDGPPPVWEFACVTPLEGAPVGLTEDEIDGALAGFQRGDIRPQAWIERFHHHLDRVNAKQRAIIEETGLDRLVLGNPLKQLPEFVLKVADDLSYIDYGMLRPDQVKLTEADLNPVDKSGLLFNIEDKVEWLLRVNNPTLITPHTGTLFNQCKDGEIDMEVIGKIASLDKLKRRLTMFRGIPLTWDESVDGKAWACNIDTVHAVAWFKDAGLFNGSLKRTAELGSGTGGISAGLLDACPSIEEHIYTDINPDALVATRRNIRAIAGDTRISYQLGKGVEGFLKQNLDLLVSNPPYLSRPGESAAQLKFERDNDVNRYGGTGVIREFIQNAPEILNPDNPHAAIAFQCSNLSVADINFYMREVEGRKPKVVLEPIGGPKLVPLQIWELHGDTKWIDHLKTLGLEDSPDRARATGHRYWHQIMAFKITVER